MQRFLARVGLLLVFTPWVQAGFPPPVGPTYRISDHVIHAGGVPVGGTELSSASYRISFAGLGEPFAPLVLVGASYGVQGSFGAGYLPPGEVHGLQFSDKTTLVWGAEGSVGHYDLYRAAIGELVGSGYGSCAQPGLSVAWASESAEPPLGGGYFYLVTASNRLEEEGTKGTDSGGTARDNPTACP